MVVRMMAAFLMVLVSLVWALAWLWHLLVFVWKGYPGIVPRAGHHAEEYYPILLRSYPVPLNL